MEFPINFTNLSYFIVIFSVILLITSELLNPALGSFNIYIRKSRLRNIAIFTSLISLGIVVIRIYRVIITI